MRQCGWREDAAVWSSRCEKGGSCNFMQRQTQELYTSGALFARPGQHQQQSPAQAHPHVHCSVATSCRKQHSSRFMGYFASAERAATATCQHTGVPGGLQQCTSSTTAIQLHGCQQQARQRRTQQAAVMQHVPPAAAQCSSCWGLPCCVCSNYFREHPFVQCKSSTLTTCLLTPAPRLLLLLLSLSPD